MYTYMHTYIHTHIHTCIGVYVVCMFVYIYIYTAAGTYKCHGPTGQTLPKGDGSLTAAAEHPSNQDFYACKASLC